MDDRTINDEKLSRSLTLYMSDSMEEKLHALGRKHRRGKSFFIREAIAQYLTRLENGDITIEVK